MTCKLKKLNKNEIFEDLNLISKLLQNSAKKEKSLKKIKKPPVIEVLNQNENEDSKQEEDKLETEKTYPNEEYRYGFNDQFFDFFKDLQVFNFFSYFY